MDKVKKYAEDLKKQEKAKDYDQFFDKASEVIKRNLPEAFDLVVSLDPDVYSVPITYILFSIFTSKETKDKIGIKQIIIFIREFIFRVNVEDLQKSSMYLSQFFLLVRIFSEFLLPGDSDRPHHKSDSYFPLRIGQPIYGVKALKAVIAKFGDQFTPVHRYFALLCISAKTYRQALPVISKMVLTGYENGKIV